MIWNLADDEVRTQTGVVVQTLCSDLQSLFEVVTPEQQNLGSYGIRIRHLLLVACTEVEAAWAGVLRANSSLPKQPTTKDYIVLSDPLELPRYAASLRDYPRLEVISPFAGWDPTNPTKSLQWYHAYNNVKHDREGSSSEGTLRNALTAVAAMLVMAAAQFGVVPFQAGARFGQNIFKLFPPEYHTIRDLYLPPDTGGSWKPVPYPFEKLRNMGRKAAGGLPNE
jgi:hypothetical protein